MKIANLTQHPATPAQIAAGVYDLSGPALENLKDALSFDAIPTSESLSRRAGYIVHLIKGNPDQAMIGGAPYLMAPLEEALRGAGIQPVYAFSVRESQEVIQSDGSVRKVNIFNHIGFVEV